MSDEQIEEQEKISFWKQIKEDFTVPKNNDPALFEVTGSPSPDVGL